MANPKPKSSSKSAGARAAIRFRKAQKRRGSKGGGRRRGSRITAVHITEEGLLIGYDRHEVRIPWPDVNGGKLILIFGKRGTGKTVLLQAIRQAALAMNYGVFTINGKADRSLSEGSKRAAAEFFRAVKRWSKKGPNRYNPYAHGDSDEIADQLLAEEIERTHPFYLHMAQRFTGHVVRALRAAGEEVSLPAVIRCFTKAKCMELLKRCESTPEIVESRKYVENLTDDHWKGLSGTRERLGILAEAEMGQWWEGGPDSIDLWQACENNEVLDFLIDGDGLPLLAKMMSRALIQDLNKLLAQRNELIEEGQDLKHLFVFIDEFGGIPADLSSLASRGRSARVTLIFSTQDLYADTDPIPYLRDRLLANFDALICLREQNPRSAELVAKVGAKIEMPVASWDEKGHERWTLDEVERIVESQIMGMPDYHAAVIMPGRPEHECVRIVRLLSPEQIAGLRYA